jgi:hypothetical protein
VPKKYAMIILVLALSISAAGCTVSHASDRDRYGEYLGELNAGNAACGEAMEQYGTAARYFSKGFYNESIPAMKLVFNGYQTAAGHYREMAGHAETPDQRSYAGALESYAESCMYAAASYGEAYAAYGRDDRYRGEAYMRDAADFIAQANRYQEKAVALQPKAIA